MAVTRYGSAASVKVRTGVGHDDLGLDSDGDLDTFIVGLLDEATDLVDRHMGVSWLPELTTPVPAGLHGIVNDIVADALRVMVQTRQTPIVRVDDFAVRTIASRTLSPDIIERLKLYGLGTKGGVGTSHTLEQGDFEPWPWHWTLADLDAEGQS